MTTSPKKWSRLPKFFPHFHQKCCFLRKNCEMKKYSKPHFALKNVIFIFFARRPFPSKETWAPKMVFRCFLRKYSFFWKKLLNKRHLAPMQYYMWHRICDMLNATSDTTVHTPQLHHSCSYTNKIRVLLFEELYNKTQQVHFSTLWDITKEDKINST